MNRPKLYQRTRAILFQAYLNGTLKPFSPTACAVANIIAANMSYSFGRSTTDNVICWLKDGVEVTPYWDMYVDEDDPELRKSYEKEAMKQIRATCYSLKELKKIEWAFDGASHGWNNGNLPSRGFYAAIQALNEIHDVKPSERLVNLIQENFEKISSKEIVGKMVMRYKSINHSLKCFFGRKPMELVAQKPL